LFFFKIHRNILNSSYNKIMNICCGPLITLANTTLKVTCYPIEYSLVARWHRIRDTKIVYIRQLNTVMEYRR
ncbi:hypothetical protein L9F63_002860, partial [Diploptera punctata]